MKKYTLFLPALLSAAVCSAQKINPAKIIEIDTVAVYSYKSTEPILATAASVSLQTNASIERNGIDSPHTLSAIVPNFYMPSYGSKLSSAIYIRGIGSRMNDPAVGMYLDNIPLMDKGMYDFDFYDIAQIEVLRGPQGTLYGRNAMGGIINVYTPSSLSQQGAKAMLSYGSGNTIKTNVIYYVRTSERTGLSVGGNYYGTDGFFKNIYDGSNADEVRSGSARARFDWQINDRWLLNYSLSGERSVQYGYPYGLLLQDGTVGDINYNDKSGYDRTWLVNSLYFQHNGHGFVLSGAASYQYLNDDMHLDQDFRPGDYFMMQQLQTQHAFTQEVVIKSQSRHRYQWLCGAMAFQKRLYTQAPVTFKSLGVAMIQSALDAKQAANPRMPSVTLVDGDGSSTKLPSLLAQSDFATPSHGVALYHQSTVNDLFTPGLSLVAGLRFDYEKVSMEYLSGAGAYAKVVLPPMMGGSTVWQERAVRYDGEMSSDYYEFLPKAAIRYAPAGRGYTLYASVAKGYTAGGHNLQLFSDLVSAKFQESSQQTNPLKVQKGQVAYKPEHSWNYEVGTHVDALAGKLRIDAALFLIDTRDRQLAQMVESGLGREMRNAGHSRSYGGEVAVTGRFGGFLADVSYGYTHATFLEYTDRTMVGDELTEVDYSGKFVPFAPRQTVSAGVEQRFPLHRAWIDDISVGLRYQGIGKVFFTDANDISQDYYSLLDGSVTLRKNNVSLVLWGRNMTDTTYKLFCIRGTNGNTFAQQGNPVQIGATIRLNLVK